MVTWKEMSCYFNFLSEHFYGTCCDSFLVLFNCIFLRMLKNSSYYHLWLYCQFKLIQSWVEASLHFVLVDGYICMFMQH